MSASAWATLVPELSCRDLDRSLVFWTEILGFSVRFDREEERFAYLERGWAQVMLEEANGGWETGPLEEPFGRGINLQIEVEDVVALHRHVIAAGVPMFRDLRVVEYRNGTEVHRAHEFLIQDPDGYLVRLVQDPDVA
ncbi:MAG: VOC family protein [Planctomycetota bacterium]